MEDLDNGFRVVTAEIIVPEGQEARMRAAVAELVRAEGHIVTLDDRPATPTDMNGPWGPLGAS